MLMVSPLFLYILVSNRPDHQIDWANDKGWGAPRIVPHGPISMDPASSVLHYGMGCFEGMKAYIDANKKIRLFRPNKNMERLHHSSVRLSLPVSLYFGGLDFPFPHFFSNQTFNKDQFLECLKQLVRLDKDWIPNQRGYSLYIRPTHIGVGVCFFFLFS
jgi:branched-chain amino acid aminotransferase